MASEVRVNRITNRSGLSTVTFGAYGTEFVGITTFEQINVSSGISNISASGVSTFTDVQINGILYDTHTNVGAGDSVLISTGIGVSWIDVATAALQGVQGIQGTQGVQGIQGVQGVQGVQGTQGVQGIQGIQGTFGTQGVQGITGPVAGAANQVVYKDGSNNASGSANLTFDGTNLVCGGTVTSNSDEKLKTNVKVIESALEKVCKLRGVEFDYKENGQHSLGFIAQEVENVIPELVFGTDPKSVAYQNFVALLVEAIKELREEINTLKDSK